MTITAVAPWKISAAQKQEILDLATRAQVKGEDLERLVRAEGVSLTLDDVGAPGFAALRLALAQKCPGGSELEAPKPTPAPPAPEAPPVEVAAHKRQRAAKAPVEVASPIQSEKQKIEELLDAPIPEGEIRFRRGPGGSKLQYLSGAYVTKTLNEVFGALGWSFTVHDVKVLGCEVEERGPEKRPYYTARAMAIGSLRIGLSGTIREDLGYCDSMPTPDQAGAESMALKGAPTDALKRCAARLGVRLGLALQFGSEERAALGLSPEGEDLDPGRRQENHTPVPAVSRPPSAPTVGPAPPVATSLPAPAPPANSAAPGPDPEIEARLDGYKDDQPIAKELANALVALAKRAGKQALELFKTCGVVPPNPPTGAQARLYLAKVRE